MKAIGVCCLVFSMFILGCTSQKGSPIQGAWKLVHARSVRGDTLIEFPGKWTGSGMKMWSKDYFDFVGRYKIDTALFDSYGGGRYRLDGNKYEEIIQYHTLTSAVGDTVKMLLEIRNDTLNQMWPVGNNGQIDKSHYREEEYVKLD